MSIFLYQKKDYLVNTRISFSKTSEGVQVRDTNNYYPFGLNHIGGSNASNFGSLYSYKYNGKELQETGMYDFGARMYMPDLGRWGVVDALAEQMRRYSPYNYAFNNPINYIDPDGNSPRDTYGEHSAFNGDFDPNSTLSSYNGMGSSSAHGMYFAQDAGGGQEGSGGETYYGKEAYDVLQSYLNPPSNNSDTGPNFWQRVGSFFGNLFGSKKKESNKVNVGIPTGSVERDMTWPIIAGLLFGNADPYSAIGNAGVGPYAEERETVGIVATLFIHPEAAAEGLERKTLSRAAMSKIIGAGIRIDPKNLPKNVTEELVEILAGRGTPIIRNGVHETVRNSAKWGGALEWKIKDIPGTSLNGSRIIQHPNEKWGLVFDHNYKNIIEIPTSSTIK